MTPTLPMAALAGQIAVPVVEPGAPELLLGTAFFVGRRQGHAWFMTARHVVEDTERLELVRMPTEGGAEHHGRLMTLENIPVENWVGSKSFDLALMRVATEWPGALSIPFGTSQSLMAPLMNIEFSQSRAVRRVGEEPVLHIDESHHIGHQVRALFTQDRRTGADMEAMLCSWPAYRGASGSPVVDMSPPPLEGGLPQPRIAGMVIENVVSELLPAHLEEIYGADGEPEERHTYYAPNAIAIAYPHLRAFVEETLLAERA